ncbi:MAG: YitT family protein [Chloroflexota bacterium]
MMKKQLKPGVQFSWRATRDYLVIFLGAALQALALRVFLVPSQLASGGVSGLAQLINHYTNWPIGLMVLVGNLPLFVLGWRYLGGKRFAYRTAFAVIVFSITVDLPMSFLPADGLTDDLVLNALYGGVISGIGFGFVYRGRGTSGGSDILGRILSHRYGIPISQSYLVTDAIIIFAAGLTFSWENALYALVMLYVSGVAAETISEGVKVGRTALIVTAHPQAIKDEILNRLGRGVTMLSGRGGYTDQTRPVLYCVLTRSEVSRLKALVRKADQSAFMVIGHAHETLGEGFESLDE